MLSKIDSANRPAGRLEEISKQKIIDNPSESLNFLVNKFKEEMTELMVKRFNDLELAAYYLEDQAKERSEAMSKDIEKVRMLKELLKD